MPKTAIVTGASRGIGRAIALELSRHFDTIAINSFTHSEVLKEVQMEIESAGTRCLAYSGDVGDFGFVADMTEDILHQCQNVDLLVNNAGISYIGLLTDMSIDDWNRLLSTNLTSVFNCCRTLVPHMVNRKSGHIINISSMWGLSGASCETAYSAAKGGVNAFTKALAKELAPSHIRVNALACGVIDTQMNQSLSDEERQELTDAIPSCRFGQAEEIAQMVWQLYCSPSYLTGEIIKIDGGYL